MRSVVLWILNRIDDEGKVDNRQGRHCRHRRAPPRSTAGVRRRFTISRIMAPHALVIDYLQCFTSLNVIRMQLEHLQSNTVYPALCHFVYNAILYLFPFAINTITRLHDLHVNRFIGIVNRSPLQAKLFLRIALQCL